MQNVAENLKDEYTDPVTSKYNVEQTCGKVLTTQMLHQNEQ
jgi:hypothetical protein